MICQKDHPLLTDFHYYAQNNLKIKTKGGTIEPFILNKAQSYIHDAIEAQLAETGKVRAIILKGRQQGCSTYTQARFYWKVTQRQGVNAFILTHEDEATKNIFGIGKRYHEFSMMKPSTKATNEKKLIFDKLDSGYSVGTANNKGTGRSGTNQYFHGSEVAFWSHADEHAKGVLQTVPDLDGTEIILESTANGIGNYYHQQWQKAESGESEYIAIFVPWYWQDEYQKKLPDGFTPTIEETDLIQHYGLTMEQIAWRRNKITELSINGIDGIKAFKQEYPNTASEAFQTSGEDGFISPDLVLKARKTEIQDRVGPLLVGVDPARFGSDRTAIIRRKGRAIFSKETYIKKDTMEVTGIIKKIIDTENPDGVFIDVGGLGAGVVDRLKEMGFSNIYPVNSGEKALDPDLYGNKRAEMWGEGKKWLEDTPCQIPDDDEIQADICGPSYRYDSKTRLFIEKKEDMKKRGLRSPDIADAMFLTFAQPIKPKVKLKIPQTSSWMS